ncbi:hypothetical protein [Ruegeria sp. Ofav3-42]|uniref:hypothetical protein n=1 Tax=Ruegeria sp. Ofav3-42 TaxID=2917759 RepID=UPI001EF49A4B|nr:hypothetical protein [Ruegeria sp. Ofav3-42]MCG7522225.1 hypothetical protein [Ruegeria sp. Ofav3-42]
MTHISRGGRNAEGIVGFDPAPDGIVVRGTGVDTTEINWNWRAQTRIEGFDPTSDSFDVDALVADQIDIREIDGSLEIEVLGNGGNVTTQVGLQAEDLTRSNLEADSDNPILEDDVLLFAQLSEFGLRPLDDGIGGGG